jgi:hypothetical protein
MALLLLLLLSSSSSSSSSSSLLSSSSSTTTTTFSDVKANAEILVLISWLVYYVLINLISPLVKVFRILRKICKHREMYTQCTVCCPAKWDVLRTGISRKKKVTKLFTESVFLTMVYCHCQSSYVFKTHFGKLICFRHHVIGGGVFRLGWALQNGVRTFPSSVRSPDDGNIQFPERRV